MTELKSISTNYYEILREVNERYRNNLKKLDYVVNFSEKTNWNEFSQKEKKLTENTVLFVGLLYKMCQVKLVLKSENDKEINKVNKVEVIRMTERANKVLKAGF